MFNFTVDRSKKRFVKTLVYGVEHDRENGSWKLSLTHLDVTD